MTAETTLDVSRRAPEQPQQRLFVSAPEFCALAISNRSLVRWDEAKNCLRGLYDPESGVIYLIHEDKLFGPLN
jgi:hypothetical protein